MDKKVIAKNAIFLFFRSIVTICIGLFAARVLLQRLGIEDYGVYNVVGGIVVMFNAMRTFFSSAIQRFLNYSKGLNDRDLLNSVFITGVEIQLILSIIFLFLMETIGLFFLYNLNLTEEQFVAAKIVYQISIVTAIISMLTVPYDALIIANERMNIFAWFSILDSILRLSIIYLIHIGPFSHLVNYALLLLVVSVFVRFANTLYCRTHFCESKLRKIWDKELMRKMGQFAGWNFIGNTGFSLAHEGVNYILNLFGGVAVNAARAIVYQVMSALNIFIGNINVAFKPQTNEAYAKNDKNIFYKLLCYNAKATISFYILVISPVYLLSEKLIALWLGFVPDFVVPFIVAVSLYYLLRAFHVPIDTFYLSIGDLKLYQIVELFWMIMVLPLAYCLLLNDYPYWSVFVGMTIIEFINHVCIVILAKIKFDFPLEMYAQIIYFPFIILVLLCVSILYYLKNCINNCGPCLSITSVFLYEILLGIMIYLLFLNKKEKKYVLNFVRKKVRIFYL